MFEHLISFGSFGETEDVQTSLTRWLRRPIRRSNASVRGTSSIGKRRWKFAFQLVLVQLYAFVLGSSSFCLFSIYLSCCLAGRRAVVDLQDIGPIALILRRWDLQICPCY